MPIIQNKGLKGLPGLNRLSEREQQTFIQANADKLSQYRSPGKRKRMADIMYNNQQFINTFGQEEFDKLNNGSQEAYNYRNGLLQDKVVSDAFAERFSPIGEDGITRDNKKGLGADYEKYFGYVDPATGQRVGGMTSDGLLKVLESDYLDNSEFEENWKNQSNALKGVEKDKNGKVSIDPLKNMGGLYQAIGNAEATGEASKERAKERNNRILEHIYNDESDAKAASLGDVVSKAYYEPSIVGSNDEETVAMFKKAITPDPSTGNMGIPTYASNYGIVEGEDISREMKDFSIDDMRDVLAKKAVYDANMSPDMTMTALNNEAKRYIHDHQGRGRRAALFAKDVAIASASYTADKVNAFYNLGLMAADKFGDKPVVWVDINGEVVDPTKHELLETPTGKVFYYDENGNRVEAHREQVNRTTLHNMGKNFDGSSISNPSGAWYKDMWTLDPQYWTKAEQYGTLDANLAEQYSKLGDSSPYKVAYNPNDDRDLLYESFKMMSFGLADMGAQLIPFGLGAAGNALSKASKLGSVVQKLGTGINTASKFLTAETKTGALAQGLIGAGGIAEAYQRGAFQETLAQNMANLEQSVANRSMQEISDLYHNDEEYKKQIDALADERFGALKAQRLAAMGENGVIVDEQKFDESVKAEALNQVLGEAIQNKIAEHKSSDDYATMQEEAINGAGLAATNTFWPEAIKYGLVNTIGFRKYLYTTPTSITQKAARNFSGLREITTSAGRKRFATDLTKTLTNVDKWKQLGKVAGGQIWGGAWTNGTDDMMVDAAERINEDSYNRYLHAYETGEALADTYHFTDGLFSYWKGLQNSLGQETTAEAAIVGGLGSTISGNLHFTNIASLATKEGREAFKRNFQQRYKRDADGMIERDADGNPIVEQVKWHENIGDRLGFFVQNGVLNEYYGKKQELRNLQEHADFVNGILDDADDFNGIENLISSDISRENATNIGDEKTMRFVHAFNAVHALEQLGKDEKDPSTLSSVVMQHKNLMERVSRLGTDESDMTEDEIANLLGQYYSHNTGIARSEEHDQTALQEIAQNARKLQEAYQAYNDAEESIQSLEKDMGAPIVPVVRFKMKMSQALDGHWRDRLQTMKDEVGDVSSDAPAEGETLIAAVGGKRRADNILKDFKVQEAFLIAGVTNAVSEQQKNLEAYNQAQQTLRNAVESNNSEAILQAQKDLKEAKDNYDEAIEERMYREDILSSAKEKQDRLQEAVDAWEKGTKTKVLSADEIMALDPVTRAKMMRELTVNPLTGEIQADPYSPAQRKQIEKLKSRLKIQDKTGDPLQKIQDIALLTQRIAQNEDAYHRISRNPDAAAVQLEKQQKEAADKAVQTINYRNAETIADYIDEMDWSLRGRKDISQKQKDDYVYKTLRPYNSTLLNIIDEQDLLPAYKKQVEDAKAWGKVVDDIDAVISTLDESQEWKDNISRNIEQVINRANNKDEIMSYLEKVIDDVNNPQVAQDFEKVLNGLEQLDYQRDATIIENRKQRKEREEAEAQRKKKVEEDAKIAMAEAQAKAQEAAKVQQAQQAQQVKADGSNLQSPWDIAPIDQGEETAVQQGGLSEPIDLTEESTSSEWQINPDTKITKEIANKEFGRSYTDAATDEYVNKEEQPKLKATADYLNGKINDKDYLVAIGFATGQNSWLDSPETTKEKISERAKKESEVRKKYLKGNKKDGDVTSETSEKDGIKITKFTQYRATKSGDVKPITVKGGLLIEPSTIAEESLDNASQYDEIRMSEFKEGNGKMSGTIWAKDKDGWTQFDVTFNSNPVIGTQVTTQQNPESSVNNNVGEQFIVDNGDSVQGKSATIDEQMTDTTGDKEAYSSEQTTDVAVANGTGEHVIETGVVTLTGNAMSEWKSEPLKSDGKLEHKQGLKQDDAMNKFYAWMNAAGVKLQNIIDQELGRILMQNPHAKVKFMTVKPEDNATHDIDMKTHLILVLDYDNHINKDITNIHNDENGGVFESNGKKYLMIGTVGYGKNNAQMKALRDILFTNNPKEGKKAGLPGAGYGLVKQGQGEFFRTHPAERFYVPEGLSTEIVPMSLIPGYIVNQLEQDEVKEYRSIRELIGDYDRNPLGLEMNDLAFGIQELTKFLVVGANRDNVMVPRNTKRNAGNAFVLIPASNGKLLSSYLKPLFYNEMMDGALKDRVVDLLNAVVSPNYSTRLQALIDLTRIFHFGEDGDNILLGKDDSPMKNQITLKRGKDTIKSFTLNDSFDRQAFMDAIAEMNPRINITKSVLQSNVLLQQYDEAGALQTDVALLSTAGSSYSIYGLDVNGNMLQSDAVVNPAIGRSTDFRNGDKRQVVYRSQYYNYDINEDTYYLNGTPVQDEALIKELDYNRRIYENGISPIESGSTWNTYILGNKEHPEGVRVNKNTYEVKEIPDAEAVKLIEKIEKEAAEKERAEAAKQILEEAKITDIPLDDGNMIIDVNTGELITPQEFAERQNAQLEEKRKKGEEPVGSPNTHTDNLHKSEVQLDSGNTQGTTQTFNTLSKSKKWRKQVSEVLKRKWPDAPRNIAALEKFLRDRNVEIDAIGTSDADVQAWIDTVENCR